MNIVETSNLTKIYQNKHIALNGANLTVPDGAVFGLVGPNGSGKTTTIKLLLGLQTPSAGKAMLFGKTMTPQAADLRQRIGYLPTNPQFPGDMNPIMYLDFVGKLFGLPGEIRKPRMAGLLRAVGLLSASSQKIKSFSTGMMTRLGIAASLMNDPDLLIWDEPTSGLDPEGRRHTIDLIQELGQHKTILVSSHDLNDIRKVCDHIGVLSDGKLIFNGPLKDMKHLARSTAIELELEGDVDSICQRLRAELKLQWERDGQSITLYFPSPDVIAEQLASVMQIIPESDTKLVAINSLQDEMTDAFIHLLEEERSHGFQRIFNLDAAINAVSGDPTG